MNFLFFSFPLKNVIFSLSLLNLFLLSYTQMFYEEISLFYDSERIQALRRYWLVSLRECTRAFMRYGTK